MVIKIILTLNRLYILKKSQENITKTLEKKN